MVKKCEVEEFLGHLRNPQTLIAGCRRYHETEPRDIAYVVSRDIIMRKPFDKIDHKCIIVHDNNTEQIQGDRNERKSVRIRHRYRLAGNRRQGGRYDS